MKKRVLAIGAYERDNFGDLLFYQLLKSTLKSCDVSAGSIIYSDMRQTLGEKVLPYTYLLNTYKWDAIWLVGGEVGGVDLDMAYHMSLEQGQVDVYSRLSKQKKAILQKTLSTSIVPGLAYLPELWKFPLNESIPFIINSVGIANISRMPSLADRRRSNRILRTATSLAVRDGDSLRYCERYDIPAILVPDAVHAIAKLPEWKKLKRVKKQKKYIAFQISHSTLSYFGRDKVVQTLVELINLLKLEVILVAAGTAVHHDSYAEYQWVQSLVHQKVGDGKVTILYSRSPSDIVTTIINSGIWIGTSLHGRIVAGAFHVPRLSLQNEKVHRYASIWDALYPSNVAIEDVGMVAKDILNGVYDSALANFKNEELTNLAFDRLIEIKRAIT